MLTVLTLICNPATPDALARARASAVETLVSGGFAREIERRILAVGEAEDMIFDCHTDMNVVRQALSSLPDEHDIDAVVQPVEGRRKRLLVADMDSTIIAQECLDELADMAGKKAEIAAITDRAMRGEIEFEQALLTRVAMLEGLAFSALDETFKTRLTLNSGAKTLVATMKTLGATTALISGGFTFFTSRIAKISGFDLHEGNDLAVHGGRLTGDVARPIKGRAAKEEALLRLAGERGMALAETMAVGDGANDLAMLGRAGLGVAYKAKPAVASAAPARIDRGDLTALLFVQGIAKADFTESEL